MQNNNPSRHSEPNRMLARHRSLYVGKYFTSVTLFQLQALSGYPQHEPRLQQDSSCCGLLKAHWHGSYDFCASNFGERWWSSFIQTGMRSIIYRLGKLGTSSLQYLSMTQITSFWACIPASTSGTGAKAPWALGEGLPGWAEGSWEPFPFLWPLLVLLPLTRLLYLET